MPRIVTYEQWMQGTALGISRPRSTQLKAVDVALKQYERLRTKKQLEFLKYAFIIWKSFKGPNWKYNDRNDKGLVTALNDMLTSPESLLTEEMEILIKANQEQITSLFKSRKLEGRSRYFKSKTDMVMTGFTARSAYKLASQADWGIKERFNQLFNGLLRDLFDEGKTGLGSEVAQEIANELGPQFLEDFIKAVTPYMGLITAGASSVYQWGKTTRDYVRENKVKDREAVIRAGDPKAALEAIIKIIDRERQTHMFNATASTIEFGAKGIVHLAGGGAAGDTVIGGIAAFAKISHMLSLVGRDYIEKRNVNKIIQESTKIDHKIFDVCPILGCYYIVCSDTSMIINFLVEDMGKNGWMDDIEEMKQKLDYIEKQSRRLIQDYRFIIKDMPKLKMSDQRMKDLSIKTSLKKSERKRIAKGHEGFDY
jgi:hypothetical protein